MVCTKCNYVSMRIILLLLSLYFVSSLCYSQSSIGIRLTPQIQFSDASGQIEESFVSKDSPSFAAALLFNNNIKNHRFSLGAGINRLDDKISFQENSSNPASKWTITGVYYTIFFPISYRYFIGKRNNKFSPFVGVGSNVYYNPKGDKQNSSVQNENSTIMKATEYRHQGTRLTLNAEVGISRKIMKRTSIDLSFVYQYGFESALTTNYTYYTDNAPYKVISRNKVSYVGLNIDFNYMLKR